MKTQLCLYAMLLLFSFAAGQDSTQVAISPSPTQQDTTSPVLSANPTAAELTQLFSSGQRGPGEALGIVIHKGNLAVPGLSDLLASSPTSSTMSSVGDSVPNALNRLLSVKALGEIGTSDALGAMVNEMKSENDDQIRGVALNCLAHSLHDRLRSTDVPIVDVVAVLIEHLGDQRVIGGLQKTMAEVAQEGLIAWLGLDFGDPIFSAERMKAGGGKGEVSAAQYASLWWQSNNTKLQWNQATRRFEIVQ